LKNKVCYHRANFRAACKIKFVTVRSYILKCMHNWPVGFRFRASPLDSGGYDQIPADDVKFEFAGIYVFPSADPLPRPNTRDADNRKPRQGSNQRRDDNPKGKNSTLPASAPRQLGPAASQNPSTASVMRCWLVSSAANVCSVIAFLFLTAANDWFG